VFPCRGSHFWLSYNLRILTHDHTYTSKSILQRKDSAGSNFTSLQLGISDWFGCLRSCASITTAAKAYIEAGLLGFRIKESNTLAEAVNSGAVGEEGLSLPRQTNIASPSLGTV